MGGLAGTLARQEALHRHTPATRPAGWGLPDGAGATGAPAGPPGSLAQRGPLSGLHVQRPGRAGGGGIRLICAGSFGGSRPHPPAADLALREHRPVVQGPQRPHGSAGDRRPAPDFDRRRWCGQNPPGDRARLAADRSLQCGASGECRQCGGAEPQPGRAVQSRGAGPTRERAHRRSSPTAGSAPLAAGESRLVADPRQRRHTGGRGGGGSPVASAQRRPVGDHHPPAQLERGGGSAGGGCAHPRGRHRVPAGAHSRSPTPGDRRQRHRRGHRRGGSRRLRTGAGAGWCLHQPAAPQPEGLPPPVAEQPRNGAGLE